MELKDGVDHPMEINIDSIVREVVRVVHEEQREKASRLNKRMQLKEAQFFSEEYVEIPDLAPGDILVKMEGSVIGDEELHRFLNGVDSQEQIGKWGTGRVVRMEGALSDCNNEKIQLNDSVVFRRQPVSRLTGDKTNYGFCNWNQQFIRIRDSKILEVINGISQESRLLYPFVSVVLADFERLEKLYHFEKNDTLRGKELLRSLEMEKVPLYDLISYRYKLSQIEEAYWTALNSKEMLTGIFNR